MSSSEYIIGLLAYVFLQYPSIALAVRSFKMLDKKSYNIVSRAVHEGNSLLQHHEGTNGDYTVCLLGKIGLT